MSIKQKAKIKTQERIIGIFLESNFVEVNRLFVSILFKQDDSAKRYKAQKLLRINVSSSTEKTSMTYQLILIWNDMKKQGS